MSTNFQKGTIVEEVRAGGWTAFKLYWRERDGLGKLVLRTKTMPRGTVRKDAEKELNTILRPINDSASEPIAVRAVTLNDLLERYWPAYVDRQKMRPSTLDGYNAVLNK